MRLDLTISSIMIALLLAGGCASHPAAPKEERSEADPWEPLNRQIHGFNTGFDKVTFKPLAKGYAKFIPKFLRTGIRNFSSNLRAPLNAINNFLQGKPELGLSETGRFITNSTIGVLGIFDVGTKMGMEKHNEDFGETFATWGVPDAHS